jgi:protein SCO1/2
MVVSTPPLPAQFVNIPTFFRLYSHHAVSFSLFNRMLFSMSTLYTRRTVLQGMGLLSLGLLAGCDDSSKLSFKYGKDLSDKIMGRNFKLTNAEGEIRMLGSYRGLMPMVFFGFTQCPAVCPTTLARAAQAKKLMGRDGERLQVVFITLDPERDTPELLDKYVKAFDPSFEALYGTLEQTAATAKEFGVFFEKVPSGDTYTLSHTATSYVFDSRGNLRLGLSASLTAKECAEDLLTVMEVC